MFYKIKGSGKKTLGYHSEMLVPVFENLYVKQFVLYADEELDYYIQESDGKRAQIQKSRLSEMIMQF